LGIVLARILSKAEFGLYSFCIFILMLLSMIARYGLESVLLRYGGAAWHDEDRVRFCGYGSWAMSLSVRNSLIIAPITLAVLYLVGTQRWAGVPVMMCMILSLPAWSLLYTISYIFKAAHKTPTSSLFEIGAVNHVSLLAIVGLVCAGRNVNVLDVSIVMLVCSFLVCGLGFGMLHRNAIWPQRTDTLDGDYSEFISTCRSVVAIMIMHMMANMGGVFFLGLTWGNSEVALFSAPLRLATASILLTTIVASVIAPRLSGLYKTGDTKQFHQLLRRGSFAVCGVNIPLLVAIAICAPWVMQIMGSKYIEAWPLLSVIAVGQIVGSLASLAPTVVCMTGDEHLWSIVMICNGTVCILVTAILCYSMGAMGAAIGTAIYQASQNWLAATIVKYRFGYWAIPNPFTIRASMVG